MHRALEFFPDSFVNKLLALYSSLSFKFGGHDFDGNVGSIGIIVCTSNLHILRFKSILDLLRTDIHNRCIWRGGTHRSRQQRLRWAHDACRPEGSGHHCLKCHCQHSYEKNMTEFHLIKGEDREEV
mmetsp:Transcript_25500/g.73382  ORF Transcript_25500/g.73382 Transcript_25500/m.73382 type:complete len:126 (+) Transcript_25500:2709-3086(+)